MNKKPEPETRSTRVSLVDSQLAHVTLITGESGIEQEQHAAKLIDVSVTGAKVELKSRVGLQRKLRIKFALADLGMELYVNAAVCWLKPAGESIWHLGCEFMPAMPERIFRYVAAEGKVERRCAERQATDQPVEMQVEVSGEVTNVKLQNHSQGGFCLWTAQPVAPGQAMVLSLPHRNFKLPAQSQWQVAADGGYLIGCAYGNQRGYQNLHAQCPSGATAS